MNVQIQMAVQTVLLVLQGLNLTEFPTEIRFWVMIAVSALQGILAVLAHYKNPDGTPASVPFNPPK